MEHLIRDYTRLASELKVHKVCWKVTVAHVAFNSRLQRTAANIREQLVIISNSDIDEKSDAFNQLRCVSGPQVECWNAYWQRLSSSSLELAIHSLHAHSILVPLQSYLRQGEISDILDSLLKECWDYTRNYNDVRMGANVFYT